MVLKVDLVRQTQASLSTLGFIAHNLYKGCFHR